MNRLRGVLAVGGILVVAAVGCKKDAAPPAPEPAVAVAAVADDGSGAPIKVKSHKPGDKHNPVDPNAPPLTLDVSIDGSAATWKKDTLDKVAKYGIGSDGDARDVWSLRELARTLVGPTAHVVSVTGPDGTVAMDVAGWADASKTPILHTTRRGTLKYTWADDKGTWGDTVVKDVTKVEISSK